MAEDSIFFSFPSGQKIKINTGGKAMMKSIIDCLIAEVHHFVIPDIHGDKIINLNQVESISVSGDSIFIDPAEGNDKWTEETRGWEVTPSEDG